MKSRRAKPVSTSHNGNKFNLQALETGVFINVCYSQNAITFLNRYVIYILSASTKESH